MAMTAAQKTDAYRFFAIAFNAAPGATYMSQLFDAYMAGMTTQQIVNVYTTKPEFTATYPVFLSDTDFATKLVNNIVKSAATTEAKAEAVADIVTALTGTAATGTTPAVAPVSRGDVIYTIFNNLANKATDDATWGATAKQMANQVTVSQYYTETLVGSSTTLSVLQGVIANVTDTTDVSTSAAIEAAIGSSGTTAGQTFTLTTGSDTGAAFTGGSGNDTFIATSATTSPTFNAGDSINGGAGTDTLNLTVDTSGASTVSAATVTAIENINVRNVSGNTQTIAAGNFSGATSFVSDRAIDQTDFTGLDATQAVGVVGNGAITNGVSTFAFDSGTAATINISGGTTAGDITQSGTTITSNTINSIGAANTVGVITVSGTVDKSLTINAAVPLTATSIGGLTTGATITLAGAATSSTGVVASIGTLDSDVIVVNAAGLTAGGVSLTMNTDASLVITGGAGNDRITTGSVLTTGSVAVGAGTADRLTLGDTTHLATSALGAKYSGFEVLSIGGGFTLDLDNLAANNTLNALRVTGSATLTNANAASAAAVTVAANTTLDLGVKGALTPSQIDTVNLTVSNGAAAVTTLTLTTPVLAGVEILGIVATDNATVTSLASALALTNVNVSGGAAVSVTTTAIALQTNFAVAAGSATGDLTFNATGATTNGFSVVGSSGINTITGGSQIFSANLAASTAKADVITLTNATGGTDALMNATISSFTNSANVAIGDHLELAGTAVVGRAGVAVAAAASSTDATVSAALSTGGVFTFSGTGAATATLATKIAIATEAAYLGGTTLHTGAFEHGGNTYIVENVGAAGYAAGTDYVVCLTGVTGVTALSLTASGATTVWAS